MTKLKSIVLGFIVALTASAASAQIANPSVLRYTLPAGTVTNVFNVSMFLQSDEYPVINTLAVYVAPGINQYRKEVCTGSVLTPYPTMQNVATGVVYTLLPVVPQAGQPQTYEVKAPGGDYVLTATTNTNPVPYLAKNRFGKFVTTITYCALTSVQYTP
jgi:hypothetical protein